MSNRTRISPGARLPGASARTAAWLAAAALAFLAAPAGRAAVAAAPKADGAAGDAATGPAQAAAVTLADDAYHLADWQDGSHDALYTEWWYFNFHDASTGVGGIFSYFVTDPLDLGGAGQARMASVAYTADGTVTALDQYAAASFSADAGRADVTIDPNASGAALDSLRVGVAARSDGAAALNTVRVAADGTYLVAGASRDGRIAWDLAYAPESEPWFAADRLQVGSLAWEKMSWLVAMPRARVTGTLTVDGRVIPIDAVGYHDHNWGEWIPTDALWNWAQFSSPRLSIEMGDFIGKPVGVVALDLDGARTVFTPDQYDLVHTRWAWDPVNRLFYPTESLLTADDGTVRLRVTLKALATDPLRGDLPLPLRDLILYEQTARYDGVVLERAPESEAGASSGGAGEWRLRAIVAGTGFKEWTGKKY